jgi:hypothetical protein
LAQAALADARKPIEVAIGTIEDIREFTLTVERVARVAATDIAVITHDALTEVDRATIWTEALDLDTDPQLKRKVVFEVVVDGSDEEMRCARWHDDFQ